MTWAEAAEGFGDSERGEVRLTEHAQKVDLALAATNSAWLFAEIPAPGPAMRGRLALLVESAIEDALDRRGAAPPGVGASSDLDASLSDQLYRARQIGARGLALAFGTLEGIANLAGALDAEDSAVLRWWFAAAAERPVRIALDARDRFLGVYAAPTTLGALLEPRSVPREPLSTPTNTLPPTPNPDPELAASVQAMDLSARPPPVEHAEDVEDTPPEATRALVESDADELGPCFDDSTDPGPIADTSEAPVEPHPEPPAERVLEAPQVVPLMAEKPAVGERDPKTEWKAWVRELDGARGPKPLSTIERMFVSAYVPLCNAVQRGLADEKAEAVLQGWASNFERSYRDAFDALRLRGKRPLMVLDLPDAAHRIGRLHGARSVQLLLVDAMRFDLGLTVQERLRTLLGPRAALTEHLLMWAALPTTTSTQLELIGKGVDGLRDLGTAAAPDSDIPVARGRNAVTVRRVKAGTRELMKLDVVEARLVEPGGPIADRLDAIATETAEALANHFLRLPPRTLVMVFGDHGFLTEPRENGVGAAAIHGGASPEEVLVPAFAWLVGDIH